MNEKKINYERATLKEIILFGGSEGMGFNSLNIFLMMFFMFYATNVYVIPVAAAGLIVTIARFFDAVTDPLIGMIVDRTNTKWGRFRPYVLIGGILFPLSGILLFWGPDVGNKTLYLLVVYLLNSIGVTFLSVAANSTRGIITQDPTQRVMLSVPSSICTTIALMFVMVGTVPITQYFGGDVKAWRIWVIPLALISFVAWRCFDYAIKKKDTPDRYNKGVKEKVTFKQQWQAFKINRPLQMIIISSASNDLATGFTTAVQMYFWLYVVKRIDLQPISSALMIPTMIIMSIVVALLAKKISKKQIFVMGSWLGLVLPLVLLILKPFDNPLLLIILMTLSTIVGPLTQNSRWPMMADCIDYGEWKTGIKTAGVISSIFTFFNKLGSSLPAVITGLILASLGFIEGADTQNQAVMTAIVWLMFGGTILGHVCSIIAMKFYPIDRELYNKMVEEMQERTS